MLLTSLSLFVAKLSVNLVHMADKFISSQNVRCDFKLLESIVIEHNKLGTKLRAFRDFIQKAQDEYHKSRLSNPLNPVSEFILRP